MGSFSRERFCELLSARMRQLQEANAIRGHTIGRGDGVTTVVVWTGGEIGPEIQASQSISDQEVEWMRRPLDEIAALVQRRVTGALSGWPREREGE